MQVPKQATSGMVCPKCGNPNCGVQYANGEFWVWCNAPRCNTNGPRRGSPEEAIAAWRATSSIGPCKCGGVGVRETRRTESASALVAPLFEFRVRCDRCGQATRWHDDGGNADAEWRGNFARISELDRRMREGAK